MVGRLQHRAFVSSFIASGDRLTLLSSPPMLCAANSLVMLQISQPHVKQHARSRIPSNIRPTVNIIVLINILIVATNFLTVTSSRHDPPSSVLLPQNQHEKNMEPPIERNASAAEPPPIYPVYKYPT